MRGILFRGKRIDNGEWVYGDLVQSPACCIFQIYEQDVCGDNFSVDPSTIGQYTGLTDKNGKKIFEGDIVHYIYDSGKENGWKVDQNSIIKWDFSGFYMDGIFGSNKYACRSGWLENIVCNGGKFFEVIGNIHDNPELLEDKP